VISALSSRATIGGVLAALWMASPADAAVTVSTAATANMSCTAGVCTPTAANAVLNVGDLTTMLASGSVTVNTGTGSLPAQVEDIIVAATFNWASANALTLDAYRSVTVTAPIAVNGAAPVALVTNDGGSGGNLLFGPGGSLSFLGTANGLTINGKVFTLVDDIATLATDVAANPSGSFALAGNYNASPDGIYPMSPIATEFSGTFEGLGNTITNFSIANRKQRLTFGLFSINSASGIIANLQLSKADLSESGVDSCIGGIVGENDGLLFGDHVAGVVTGFRYSSIGGLVGLNEGSVTDSSASTSVIGFYAANVGGLVGYNDGASAVISASYAAGSAKGLRSNLGGLVGNDTNGVIVNSYSTGTIEENGSEVPGGGMIGQFIDGTVSEAYSTGRVKDGGGFLGEYLGLSISSSYWDTQISNEKYAAGNARKVPGVTGETTAKLQAGLPSGFDPTIWAESPSINNGLPYLINNPPQ
jgi:hypothetical protein